MKVITLTQPWASLVAIGAKRIETRSWSTNYRGPMAIHAAKGLGSVGGKEGFKGICFSEPFLSALTRAKPNAGGMFYHEDYFFSLPFGAIVAVCDLTAVARVDYYKDENWRGPVLNFGWRMDYLPGEPELSFGDYSVGRYIWQLENVRALPEPIPIKGALGLWNYDGVL